MIPSQHSAARTLIFPQIAETYRGSYFSKVRSSVANFVAKSGKGAVQGAVQAAVQCAVARSGSAVQGAVPECGGDVWQRCCAGCCPA